MLSKKESNLNQALYYDALTGLPNQVLFREQFSNLLHSQVSSEDGVSVIYLSLDRFSHISQSLDGYQTDFLLLMLATRLKQYLENRAQTSGSLFRLHSEEFLVMLPNCADNQQISRICQEILQNLALPFQLGQNEVYLTASLGVSIYSQNEGDWKDLLQRAKISMLSSRNRGGNNFSFFMPEMHTSSADQFKLETRLHSALKNNELEVYYQPQIHTRSGQVVGAEALIRWKHPELGYISPEVFIPIAEDTGLIHPIGEWVLKTAYLEQKSWQEAGFPSLRIAVNISSQQLYEPDFIAKVVRIVNDTGIAFTNLELELTESALLNDIATANSRLASLKALGIQIAIDDLILAQVILL